MAVSIDRTTFPAEGGTFSVNITKEDSRPWEAPVLTGAFVAGTGSSISPYLYQMDLDIQENTGASDRTFTLQAGSDMETETFTLTQLGTGTTISAEIIASTAGNTPASGGQVTVDIYANGGTDSLTTASSDQAYLTLTSTAHGVTSGGYTCTRFVFTFSQNTSTSSRSATLTFTVDDGNGNTATATQTRTQNGAAVNTGSLSVASVSAAASATSANALISYTDVNTATLAVDTTTFNFVTSATIQVIGGAYNLAMSFPANTGAARTESIQISATDSWGNTLTASMTLAQAAAGASHSISVAWRTGLGYDGVLDYQGGQEDALVTTTGTFTGDASVSYGTLPDGVTVSMVTANVLRATYTGGNISETIYIPITVSKTGDDNVVYSADIVLTLAASGVFPIWQDVFGEIASDEDWEDYELDENGSLFYSGRAFAYPDESGIRVNVSRVVAPYLVTYWKDVDFISGGTTLASYTFVRDYSYDRSMDYTQTLVLNAPINGKVPSGVALSASVWAPSASGSLQVTDEGGALVVNEALSKGLNTGSWISGMEGKSYTIGGSEEYTVVSACRGALLKYVNAYGAVDFFLVEGVAKKSDKISRATYEKDAAAMSAEFETADYQASMEAEWTGATGWLTDAQSMRMKHLVESVEVYMIDIATGDEIPVVMRDSTLDYKTFDSSGRKLVNYSLKWTESQKKLRR